MDSTKLAEVLGAVHQAEWRFGDGSKVKVSREFINGYPAHGFLATISVPDRNGVYAVEFCTFPDIEASLRDFLDFWAKDHNGFIS